LRSCIADNALITRYGGDEFCIILKTQSEDELFNIVERINAARDMFNLKSKKPYKIYFSMGYDIYDYDKSIGADEFLRRIDRQMYEQKKEHKLRSEAFYAAQNI
jgi:diguanylate cyclase (GGDEF)-like protein